MTNKYSYRYLLTDTYRPSTVPIKTELPFTNVSFNSPLNGIGTFQGTLLLSGINNTKLDTLAQTVPMQKSLFVDYGNQIIWGGIITSREYDSENQTLTIIAQEFEFYLNKRRINKFTSSSYYVGSPTYGSVYSSIDSGTILYDLVTNMQVNNTAMHKTHTAVDITPDNFTTGSTVSRTYFDFELKSVYQALKDLSQGSFFDFKIIPAYGSGGIDLNLKVGNPATPNSPLNRVYDASSTSQSPTFQFPGNLTGYKYTQDGTTTANYAWGIGYGKNYNKLLQYVYDSSKIGSGGTWPLIEETYNFIDVQDVNTLSAVTNGIASGVSTPPTTIQVTMPPWVDPPLGAYGGYGGYQLGDQVRLIIQDEFLSLDWGTTDYRISEIAVTPGSNGPDRVTITLMLPYATITGG
jgi:hypothetical protein